MHGLAMLCVCEHHSLVCVHVHEPVFVHISCACMCGVSMCVRVCISHLPVSGPVTSDLHVYVHLCSGSTEVAMLGHV